jgi:hypothetical protein
MQQAGILQQQQEQQRQKLPEAPRRREGNRVKPQKLANFVKYLTYEGPGKSSMLAN